jgi:signal transduction histidine kinase
VDLSRASKPLTTALRAGFAAVVIAALAVDGWALGAHTTRTAVVSVVLIAMVGVGWACWPSATEVAAIAASLLSLIATVRTTDHGFRFALFTEFVVLPVLLAAVLTRRSAWRAPVAALVVVAAETVSLRAESGPVRWIVAISMLVLLGVAATAVMYMRLRDDERRTTVELARQTERLELARELHDLVGHHVTGIVVLAQANRFAHAQHGGGDADVARAMEAIEAAGMETLTSVRRLVGLLRDDPSLSVGATLNDIEHVVADLRTTHSPVTLVADGAIRESGLPGDLAPTVLRLAQEASTNVRRHGDPDARTTFDLRISDGSVVLTVDNGVMPGPPGASGGYGLIGMRERVEALGGTLTSGPVGTQRWMLRATLPVTARR